MTEAISDTGPVLHLSEVGRLRALDVFARILIPRPVAEELTQYGLDPQHLDLAGSVQIVPVREDLREEVLAQESGLAIHRADAEVVVLAMEDGFHRPVLTDDLALRRRLEALGGLVVGTLGVLVRAYKKGLLAREELDGAVDSLFTESTLHLSSAFRAYIRSLLAGMG